MEKKWFLLTGKELDSIISMFNVFWKVELVSDEIGYWAEEIPKQSVGSSWLLIEKYEKRKCIERENVEQKEVELKDLEKLTLFIRQKVKKYIGRDY